MRKILVVFLFCLYPGGVDAQEDRPSVALILGGGGARGFAHAAVLEVIDELGIPVDMIAGISSGAIVGGLYAIGYSPAMILDALSGRDWPSIFQDSPVSPFWNRSEELPLVFSLGGDGGPIVPDWGNGFSSGQRAYSLFKSLTAKIPSYIDFDNLPIPFRAGAVEVPAGKFKLLDSGDLAEAIRASMSIQGIFEPFAIDGERYVDGGILNNLPVREIREMGFDIIIAVDLFAPPAEFATAPLEIPDLMNILYSNMTSREQHDAADVVFYPLPADASAVDFSKGMEIYALAKNESKKLVALLEPVRERVAAGRPGSRQAYNDTPTLVPQRLVIKGALSRDRSSIERSFSRLVRGKALEEENVLAFLESVYETGNYLTAAFRMDMRYGEPCLELILRPVAENKFLLRTGFDYEGTFSSSSTGKAALSAGLEFRKKDGLSLFVKAGVLEQFSLGFSLFLPFGPHFFLSTEADLVHDEELIVKGFLSQEELTPNRMLYFRGALMGGLRLNRYNSFALQPEYFWFKNEDQSYTMAGICAAYTFTSFDRPLFPSRGFRGKIENRLRFSPDDFKPFDFVNVDLAASIPLSGYFSLGVSGFGSSLFGDSNLPAGISTFDSSKAHRIYFPHAPWVFSGEKRAALSLALRFEPWESLSMLGGRLVFSLAGSAGRAGSFEWDDWTDFSVSGSIWNASLGAALVLPKDFALFLRAGAGGAGHQTAPFVSLDIGFL